VRTAHGSRPNDRTGEAQEETGKARPRDGAGHWRGQELGAHRDRGSATRAIIGQADDHRLVGGRDMISRKKHQSITRAPPHYQGVGPSSDRQGDLYVREPAAGITDHGDVLTHRPGAARTDQEPLRVTDVVPIKFLVTLEKRKTDSAEVDADGEKGRKVPDDRI